ncbi:MAG: class I SAM-dependent methyltransferase [Elusimicrobia bacterium]|nr:class I SAM-dependent methyltransferase [Elusimicrobiota bacterium]
MSNTEDYRARLYKTYSRTHAARQKPVDSLQDQARWFAAQYGGLLPKDKDAWICELGCGSGAFLWFLRSLGYKNVMGVDLDAEHAAAARELGLEGISHGDALEFLRVHARKFDCVIALDFLEHFRKDELFPLLDLIAGALKGMPGEAAVIGRVPNADGIAWGRIRCGDLTHELAFTAGSLHQLFLTAGFSKVEVYPEEPVVTGCKSALRWLLWQPIKLGLKLYLFAESYSHADARLTANVIFRASL